MTSVADTPSRLVLSALLHDPVLLLSLVGAGAVAGVLAGLLGVGGGIVLVPVMFGLFSVRGIAADVAMPLAVGTSLATIVPTALSSIRAHWLRGGVDLALLRVWAPGVAVGAIAGALLAPVIGGRGLAAAFGITGLLVGGRMLLAVEPRTSPARLAPILQTAIASVIGAISAMIGIGGGAIAVPAMALSGIDMRRAVGTGSAIGLIVGALGAVGFVVTGWSVPGRPPDAVGYLSLMAFTAIVPLTVVLAPVGAALAHRMPTAWLRRAFGAFLALTAGRMLYGAVG